MIAFIVGSPAFSQISISPKRILLGSRDRSKEIIVSNSGTQPYEFTANIALILVRTDSLGNETYDTVATPQEATHSCKEWVRVFPRKFTLAPNSTRTIRVLATPPAGLPDGEFVARLVLSSMESHFTPVNLIDTTKIATEVHFRLNMNLQVVYRKGKVATGLEMTDVRAIRNDSGTSVIVDVRALGNASYRGTLSTVVLATDGTRIDSTAVPFVVEIIGQRQRLRMRPIPDGTYKMVVESRTELPGSAIELVIPAPTVRRRFTVVVTAAQIHLTPLDS